MEFELRENMTDYEIYKIMDGKISGEGTEQVKTFMFPRFEDLKDKPEKLHQVIKANEKYAVIKKAKTLWSHVQYYLTGISDEGWYFLHDLPSRIEPEKKSIDEILNEINFTVDGFQRIQGDILLKFIDFDEIEIREESIPSFKYEYAGLFKRKIINKKIIPSSLYPLTVVIRNPFRQMFFNPHSKENTMIGNHQILVENGKNLHAIGNTSHLVFGERFGLKHNEHKYVQYEIPKEKIALLTMQLSRTQRGSD